MDSPEQAAASSVPNDSDIPLMCKSLPFKHFNLDLDIPCVRVHTIDIQPTKTNFGKIFQRNQFNNYEEVKLEPIKSESSEGIILKENLANVVRTIENVPITSSMPKACSIGATPTAEIAVNNELTLTCIHKCNQCRYMSLNADSLKIHFEVSHSGTCLNSKVPNSSANGSPKLLCPGCDNIFYAQNSLKVHLLSDHLMSNEEVSIVFASQRMTSERYQLVGKSTCNNQKMCETDQGGFQQAQRKSRIYLKNVEFLREPRQSSTFGDSFQSHLTTTEDRSIDNVSLLTSHNNKTRGDSPIKHKKTQFSPNQNTSMQSVDVTERMLLHESEYFQSLDFLSTAKDTKTYNDNVWDTSSVSTALFSKNNQDIHLKNGVNNYCSGNPCRSKVYIKNVDIFKEPVYLPSNNFKSILNVSDDVHFNILQPSYTSSKLSSDTDADSMSVPSSLDTIQLEQTAASLPRNFSANGNEKSSGTSKVSYVAAEHSFVDLMPKYQSSVTEALNVQESLFQNEHKTRKNVEMLKQPQFQENPRRITNLLHLRTVDELNLMNKNEVENLIAPNLDGGGMASLNEINTNQSSINYKNSEVQMFSITTNKAVNTLSESIKSKSEPSSSNWTDDNVFNGIHCVIDSNSSSKHSSTTSSMRQNSDLHTPLHSTTIPFIRDVQNTDVENSLASVEYADDPEILFVCAEEFINGNNQDFFYQNEHEQVCELSYSGHLKISDIIDDLKSEKHSQLMNKCDSVELNEIVHKTETAEKGRIYVSENLMQIENSSPVEEISRPPSTDNFQTEVTVKKIEKKKSKASRGRPFGSNYTGITKMRKLYASVSETDVGIKCDVDGCAFRFKKQETVEYHKKCHNSNDLNPYVCPECYSTSFSSWNTLHTHIWRSHKIDMELHTCEICNFKTPVYSRLINTHSKIHSEERNFKCDQCEKTFKNSRQLKNHRRHHRTAKVYQNRKLCCKKNIISNVSKTS